MPLGTEVGLGPDDTLLDGDPAPPSQKGLGRSPIFGPCLLWPNGWMDQDRTYMEVGLVPGHIVLDGDPAPLPEKGTEPLFSAHFYCGQTAGCIKMPLGIEVGLSPGDFVFDGDPAIPPQKGGGAPSPIFGPCLVAKRLDRSRWHLAWWLALVQTTLC